MCLGIGGLEEQIEQDIKAAVEKSQIETVKKMYKEDLSVEIIERCTQFNMEEISKIIKRI
jgi:hypothetical protein